MTQPVKITPIISLSTVALENKTDSQYVKFRDWLTATMDDRLNNLDDTIIQVYGEPSRVRLVKVNADLFKILLEHLPSEVRQQYTCRTCERFFNGYGTLALLHSNLELIPLAWTEKKDIWGDHIEGPWAKGYRAILDVFISRSTTFDFVEVADIAAYGNYAGLPENGGWKHFAKPNQMGTTAALTGIIDSNPAKERNNMENRTAVHAAFQNYNTLFDKLGNLIPESEMRPRDVSELQMAKKFTGEYFKTHPELRARWVSKYLFDLGLGIVHFKNSVVGALLNNLEKPEGPKAAVDRYRAMIDPVRYKRKITLPSEKEFEKSGQFLVENGYLDLLACRFAKFDEVKPQLDWVEVRKDLRKDPLDRLRKEIKGGVDAASITGKYSRKENISIFGFVAVMKELIAENRLQRIAVDYDLGQIGIFSTGQDPDAGKIYKDGNSTRPMYFNEFQKRKSNLFSEFDRFAQGLYFEKDINGREMLALVYADVETLMAVPALVYVEDLIPELHPHQRTIDAIGKRETLNPRDLDDKPMPALNTTLIYVVQNDPNATITVVSDTEVVEYVIVSMR